MEKIITSHGVYEFKKKEMAYTGKYIDQKVAKQNLLDLKKELDIFNIPFGLIFGTLLGAIREKGFIEHDEDIDIYILDEYRGNVLNSLYHLRTVGFEVIRYDGDLLSIIRDDDFIDIYFFKKISSDKRKCNWDTIGSKYLDKFDTLDFLDETFNIPSYSLELLEFLYGKDWHIPKKNSPANAKSNLVSFLFKLAALLPDFLTDFLRILIRSYRKN